MNPTRPSCWKLLDGGYLLVPANVLLRIVTPATPAQGLDVEREAARLEDLARALRDTAAWVEEESKSK